MPFKANSALLKRVFGLGGKSRVTSQAAPCCQANVVDAVLKKAGLNSLGFVEWKGCWNRKQQSLAVMF